MAARVGSTDLGGGRDDRHSARADHRPRPHRPHACRGCTCFGHTLRLDRSGPSRTRAHSPAYAWTGPRTCRARFDGAGLRAQHFADLHRRLLRIRLPVLRPDDVGRTRAELASPFERSRHHRSSAPDPRRNRPGSSGQTAKIPLVVHARHAARDRRLVTGPARPFGP
jgi:hypothetical protein